MAITYSQQIILTIIDSGIIGLAIVYVGYIFSLSIEKFKTNQNLRSELAKKQIEALIPLLNELSAIRGKLDYFFRTVSEHGRRGRINIVLANLEGVRNEINNESSHNLEVKRKSEEIIKECIIDIEELEQHAKSMEIRVSENAFWLRDPLHNRVREYQKAIFDYASHTKALAQEDLSTLMKANVSDGLNYHSDDEEREKKIDNAERLGERLIDNVLTVSEFYKILKKSALW